MKARQQWNWVGLEVLALFITRRPCSASVDAGAEKANSYQLQYQSVDPVSQDSVFQPTWNRIAIEIPEVPDE